MLCPLEPITWQIALRLFHQENGFRQEPSSSSGHQPQLQTFWLSSFVNVLILGQHQIVLYWITSSSSPIAWEKKFQSHRLPCYPWWWTSDQWQQCQKRGRQGGGGWSSVTADPSSWMSLFTCIKNAVATAWGASNVRVINNTYMSMDSLLYIVIQWQELTSLSPQYFDLTGVTADPSSWMSFLTYTKKVVAAVWGASNVRAIVNRYMPINSLFYVVIQWQELTSLSPPMYWFSWCNCWSLFLNEPFDLY